jgi:hypothetical protein
VSIGLSCEQALLFLGCCGVGSFALGFSCKAAKKCWKTTKEYAVSIAANTNIFVMLYTHLRACVCVCVCACV